LCFTGARMSVLIWCTKTGWIFQKFWTTSFTFSYATSVKKNVKSYWRSVEYFENL